MDLTPLCLGQRRKLLRLPILAAQRLPLLCPRLLPRSRLPRQARWRWILTRRLLDVIPPYDEGCMLDDQGKPFFATSAHSHIEEYREPRHGRWGWLHE